MSGSDISHVSDTALMTAACRALETERPDGWVNDPLAARLAGDRGMAIAQALPRLHVMCFGIGMRSRIIDSMLLEDIPARGINTVLSVGAGLDTRPWRLELPPDLRWVEVDLQPILEYKAEILASVKPKCRVESMVADLNDPLQRRSIFQAATPPALLITEGLLMYLPAATVESISTEAAVGGIRYWLLDLNTTAASRAIRMSSFSQVEAVRAPDNLPGEELLQVLDRAGWNAVDSRTYGQWGMQIIPPARKEALARAMAAANPADLPPPPPQDDPSGVHLFAR